MSGVVLRYEVPGAHSIPVGSEVASFGYQPERRAWSVWMVVPSESVGTERRHFEVVATGQSFTGQHRATAIMPDDFHVFHLVETP